MTLSRPQVAALLADNGLAPQRSLGQNFVVDPNTVRKIARIADVRASDEGREGLQSFLGKRAPGWLPQS